MAIPSMTLLEAIQARHSVRRYKEEPLPSDIVVALQAKIDSLNAEGRLHIQLVRNEPKAFRGVFAYGTFSGVTNYFVVTGQKTADLDERAGYYGEKLVLYAQTLGLNTCWVGLSYTKVKNTYTLAQGEKVVCYIAVGYGETQGATHKIKSPEAVSNMGSDTPRWFNSAVGAALLAPTAVNQQKFRFEYMGGNKVAAHRLFSFIGYTQIDMGIAKCHFEIGAEPERVEWA